MTGSSFTSGPSAGGASPGWRTRDIVITAIIGVAFGVVMWAWGIFWSSLPSFWANDLLYGPWLVPAVLAPLIVRKPGAALFAELVAAGVSAYLGSAWGFDALVSGLVQGLGAEVVFAATRYRSWSFPTLALAAVLSAAAAWLHDWTLYYADVAVELQLLRGLLMAVSAVVVVAWGSVLLVRALGQSGVLDGFPGGPVPQGTRAG
jgi:energy-coupling factor transport system substrate-specific component